MKPLGYTIITLTGAILAILWAVQLTVHYLSPPRYLVPSLLVGFAIGVAMVGWS